VSANHNQNFSQAVRIIEAARTPARMRIKLQPTRPIRSRCAVTENAFGFSGGTLWDGRTLHDPLPGGVYALGVAAETQVIADELGLHLFSSAFDDSAVDFLEQMNVPAHKVASFELVDIGLIQKMARTGSR